MSWTKFFTSWFFSFLMAWMPFAAYAAPMAANDNNKPTEKKLLSVFQESKYQVRTEWTSTGNTNGYTYIVENPKDPDGPKAVIDPTPEEELKRFSPKETDRKFWAMMKRAAKAGVAPIQYFGNPAVHSAMRFPKESALFFMAIGAVMSLQMIANYGANPTRGYDHVKHSISPAGMFSFYMFMYSMGLTTTTLEKFFGNPKFRPFIPYLGMSVGMFVSGQLGQFMADPNVGACIDKWRGIPHEKKPGENPNDPCDEAFNWYVVKRRLYEAAPGLISMLGSTLIAGYLQKGATAAVGRVANFAKGAALAGVLTETAGGAAVRGAVMRVSAMSVFVIATRFGLAITGVGLIGQIAQMALFYFLDAGVMNRWISFRWRNIFDGVGFNSSSEMMVDFLVQKKRTNWQDTLTDKSCTKLKRKYDCEWDFASRLEELREDLAGWRMMNLMEVYEGHAAWQTKLNNMNGLYNATYNYYSDFVNEAIISKTRKDGDKPSRLDIPYPLLGVTPDGFAPEKMSLQYSDPQFVEVNSAQTAKNVGEELTKLMPTDDFKRSGFLPHEIKFLEKLATNLKSAKVMDQGQAVLDLQMQYRSASQLTSAGSYFFAPLLKGMLDSLGEQASPTLEPGRGFSIAFQKWSSLAPQLKDLDYRKASGLYQTPMLGDLLNIQMVCGPEMEKKESIVSDSWGSMAEFYPPQLVKPDMKGATMCGAVGAHKAPSKMMYTNPIEYDGKTYKGALDFAKNNLKPAVFGTKRTFDPFGEEIAEQNFDIWWEQNTVPQMRAAYDIFSDHYDGLMAELVHGLKRNKDSNWNAGPVHNGILLQAQQEVRFNLMILGEMLKDLFRIQRGGLMPRSYFSSKPEGEPVRVAEPRQTGRGPVLYPKIPLFETLQQDVLEWGRIARLYPQSPGADTTGRVLGYPLQIQKEIQYEFDMLMWLLKTIRVVEYKGRERVLADFETNDLERQSKQVVEKLSHFADLLGVGEKETANKAIVKVSPEQREIATTLLSGLQKLAQELSLYGMMINAVSWDRMRQLRAGADPGNLSKEQIEMLFRAAGARGVGKSISIPPGESIKVMPLGDRKLVPGERPKALPSQTETDSDDDELPPPESK